MKKTLLVLALLVVLVSPVLAQPECPPQAVDLVSFTAQIFPGHSTLVGWETAQELDNLGFNLYRSTTEDGPRVKLNDTLLPAENPGTVMGAEYAFVDEGTGRWYWLEDVDLYGVSTFHGPASVDRMWLIPVRPRPSARRFEIE